MSAFPTLNSSLAAKNNGSSALGAKLPPKAGGSSGLSKPDGRSPSNMTHTSKKTAVDPKYEFVTSKDVSELPAVNFSS